MKLVSLNISLPKWVEFRGRKVSTGIFKEPVDRRLPLRRLNLEGDGQADLSCHGGLNKAVYAYPREHYPFWTRELGRTDLVPGQFGENFTVEGLTEEAVHLGDVFRVGGATVQVTQPRVPCYKLGIRMGNPQFPKLFLASGLLGFYLCVLEEGEVGAGDAFHLVEAAGGLSVKELWHVAFMDTGNLDRAREALRCRTLGPEWRERLLQRLSDS